MPILGSTYLVREYEGCAIDVIKQAEKAARNSFLFIDIRVVNMVLEFIS